jgi:subtilase family serine protease
MHRKFVVAAAVTAGLGSLVVSGPAVSAAPRPTTQACASASAGSARCLAAVQSGSHAAALSDRPSGLGPADLAEAYSLPTARGKGQTIAIVDAYDDPNAESDLAVYREAYGLPPCTSASGCFSKINQRGEPGSYPPVDPGWAVEISLDLDMVSAACPLCSIVLVEGDSADLYDLGIAVDTAAALHPAAISNSYGALESDQVVDIYGAHWRHPGTTVVASSGDEGFTLAAFPADLDSVITVGGTALQRADNARGWTEHAWSGAGSGCSTVVAKPAYQKDGHCHMRTTSDVAAVADPQTGVSVYDSVDWGGPSGWLVAGGTSAGAPIIAGIVGLAGNGATIDASYPYRHRGGLHDVVGGSNKAWMDCGSDYLCNAKKGYDGPTGWGTPSGIGAF